MDNWIESEEHEIEERKRFSIDIRRRIETKKLKIRTNYEQNREKFSALMNEIFTLIDRVITCLKANELTFVKLKEGRKTTFLIIN